MLICPVELLVASALQGQRYQNRPIYYLDVIVQSESPYTCFDDLQGCTWAYKDPYATKELHKGRIECFVAVQDGDYGDIRTMLALAQSKDF